MNRRDLFRSTAAAAFMVSMPAPLIAAVDYTAQGNKLLTPEIIMREAYQIMSKHLAFMEVSAQKRYNEGLGSVLKIRTPFRT